MSSNIFLRDLQRIVFFVREYGGEAMVDGDAVAIMRALRSGSEPRVRTLAEAWEVLQAPAA